MPTAGTTERPPKWRSSCSTWARCTPTGLRARVRCVNRPSRPTGSHCSSGDPSASRSRLADDMTDLATPLRSPERMTHLAQLEAEAIHIMREVVAQCERPVMLYSIGKDSSVMLHLARKAPFAFCRRHRQISPLSRRHLHRISSLVRIFQKIPWTLMRAGRSLDFQKR